MSFTQQFVRVNTGGPDKEGCLLFDNDDTLVAALLHGSAVWAY